MKAYLDSSSFAKRFIDEAGSDKVEATCLQASALGLSAICLPEVVSALNRRRRERTLTQGQYEEAKRRLLDEVRDAHVIDLTMPVVRRSIGILELHPVRAMDALHIASALEWGADLFASADDRQLAVAKRVGLRTLHT